MTGLAETKNLRELAEWLEECLSHDVPPSRTSLKKVVYEMKKAEETIERLSLRE